MYDAGYNQQDTKTHDLTGTIIHRNYTCHHLMNSDNISSIFLQLNVCLVATGLLIC